MRRKEIADVQDIKEKEIVKTASVAGKNISIKLQNAYVGKVGGHIELLDEVLIDNMFEQIVRAIKTNYSKYNCPNDPKQLLMPSFVSKIQH